MSIEDMSIPTRGTTNRRRRANAVAARIEGLVCLAQGALLLSDLAGWWPHCCYSGRRW
jgi:hypothetical protein